MKQLISVVALMCAVAFQAKAQTNVEQVLEAAEKLAELADKNPTDGKMQYHAALQFINDGLGDKRDYDRALTYANRALKIAQEQKELKDTLMGLTCYTLATIYVQKQEYQNASDFAEKAIDAFQQELGRSDALTISTKLLYGNFILQGQPFRGFPKVLEAFVDNGVAPEDKRIENMDEANIMLELAIERLIAEFTYRHRYALPIITYEGQPYLIVQTPDWNMERPLVGWCLSTYLRTKEEDAAFEGDDIILYNNDAQFKVVPFEERKKLNLTVSFRHNPGNPRQLLGNEGDARLWFLAPDFHQELLTKYREFKNKK